MNSNYVFEIAAQREGKLPPSFYAWIFSAYNRVRFAFREGKRLEAMAMLTEFERVHKTDKFYFTYRTMLDVYVNTPAPVSMPHAA